MPPTDQSADKSAWERLGRLLADRRVQIAPRYRNKNLFAAEREINRRMLWQVESGDRDNYRPDTIRAIEVAYMLAPGAIDRALAGGDLEPAPEPPRPHSAPPPSGTDALRALFENEPEPDSPEDRGAWDIFPAREDYALRWIWRSDRPEQERRAMIKVVRGARSGEAGSSPGESAAG